MEFKDDIPDRHPLTDAAFNGDLVTVKRLLKDGADPNLVAASISGTPLHAAIANGQLEVVKCLVEAGADVNLKGPTQWTPLFHAVDVACDSASQLDAEQLNPNDVGIICLLMERGADPRMTSTVASFGSANRRQRRQETPAQAASTYGRVGLARFLVVIGWLAEGIEAREIPRKVPGTTVDDVNAYFEFVAGGGPRGVVLKQISS